MKTNYHTHTPRCMHASGSEREYARRAVEAGYSELGFADHCPWNYGRNFVSDMRMEPGELKDYARAAKQLNLPLEYNLNGLFYCKGFSGAGLGYPCRAFWEIAAQEGVSAVIGVDAHSPDLLSNGALYDEAAQTLEELGIQRLERLAL